jgi:hypothetical protein
MPGGGYLLRELPGHPQLQGTAQGAEVRELQRCLNPPKGWLAFVYSSRICAVVC